MTSKQKQAMADSIASMLVSYAAHGLATFSLDGMGEITLRDGLIVATAAVAASTKQAWILDRELTPAGWTNAVVDLVVSKTMPGDKKPRWIAGAELKWWRREDGSNAANRRRDLLKDFLRAAALYTHVEDLSLVALLSTAESWKATANTEKTDKEVMKLLEKDGTQKWNVTSLKDSKALKAALTKLNGNVPICNIFHTELMSEVRIYSRGTQTAFARVWAVKKPQKTKFLSSDVVEELVG